jgi:hypothetical protein
MIYGRRVAASLAVSARPAFASLASASLVFASLAFASLLLHAAAAQDDVLDLDETHEYRIAFGDIPSTSVAEPAAQWNVLEHHDLNGTDVFLPLNPLAITPVLSLRGAPAEAAREDLGYRITFDEGAAGTFRVRLSYGLAGQSDRFVATLAVPDASPGHCVLYLDPGARIAFVNAQSSGQMPAGERTLHDFPGVIGTFAVQVGAESVPPGPTGGFDWTMLVIGLLVGAAVWAILVRQGVVQKRTRKQTATVAAHKQAAAREDKPTLEGRKRLLMAALKELEMAKIQKEIDAPTYDALKADFKRQAVTTMRALEETK